MGAARGWRLCLLLLPLLAELAEGRGRERFRLRHVVPAAGALAAQRANDSHRVAQLFAWQERPGLQGVLDEGAVEVSVQDREEYIFERGLEQPLSMLAEHRPFLERLPAILPKPGDYETILSFAKMSANSYVARSAEGWHNTSHYQDDDGFGWNSTGLRGHIFVNELRTIVIISFKGTSTILHGGETVARDKYTDNMIFSCCCARVDPTWTPICGCFQGSAGGSNLCDQRCLQAAARSDQDSYYLEALAVTQLTVLKYPRAQIWFTGHSLGGAIAALMAVTVRRTAAVTFASPGPYLYSRRLGVEQDAEGSQWRYPVWNYGLSTDPIFMGTCTGLATSCYLSGYAIETACRHGMDCLFNIRSWQPDVSTHRIDWMIDHVLGQPEKYPLPVCVPNRNCSDCAKWTFV